MALTVGESGANKIIRVAAGYDMSSETELTLDFTLPDDTTSQKTTADGVVLGAGVTDPDLGVLAANEYVDYPVEVGFLSQAGEWDVKLTYTNTVSNPDDTFIGTCVSFTVLAATC